VNEAARQLLERIDGDSSEFGRRLRGAIFIAVAEHPAGDTDELLDAVLVDVPDHQRHVVLAALRPH
jgi:hypothetical protein